MTLRGDVRERAASLISPLYGGGAPQGARGRPQRWVRSFQVKGTRLVLSPSGPAGHLPGKTGKERRGDSLGRRAGRRPDVFVYWCVISVDFACKPWIHGLIGELRLL